MLDQPPVPKSFVDDFVAYWGLLAFAVVRSGRRELASDFDRDRLDNLTLGLDRHASRNMHRMPLAMARLATIGRAMTKLYRQYDVALMPTLAEEPPPIGHLDPTAGYEQIMDRLARVGGVHALAERHRRPGHLAAARGIRGRPAGRHDDRRTARP